MSYHHLSIQERACISVYVQEGKNQSEIAQLLQRNKSTISREFHRNNNNLGQYNACGAMRKYNKRRKRCIRAYRIQEHNELYVAIFEGLEQYFSPEQIVHTLPPNLSAGLSTIYRAIKRKLFPKTTAMKLRRYRKISKSRKDQKHNDYSDAKSIKERPFDFYDRSEIGHWELDTVVLAPQYGCHLATMVERYSRYTLIALLPNKSARSMTEALVDSLSVLPASLRKTLTADHGLEFSYWREIEQRLNVQMFFAQPYKPYQRGTNENTNGLIRQFFPRGLFLSNVDISKVLWANHLLNLRPRKCLNWKSPSEVFMLHFT